MLWWTSSGSRANSFWVWLVLLYSAHLNQIQTNLKLEHCSFQIFDFPNPQVKIGSLCALTNHHCCLLQIGGKQASAQHLFHTHDVWLVFLNKNEVSQLLLICNVAHVKALCSSDFNLCLQADCWMSMQWSNTLQLGTTFHKGIVEKNYHHKLFKHFH